MTDWSFQEAKKYFGALVKAASRGKPQHVTCHGKPAVVIISVEEYARLQELEKTAVPTMGEWLLKIPRDGEPFDRVALKLREQRIE